MRCHEQCSMIRVNFTKATEHGRKKQVLGCISTPGSLKLLKGMMCRGILWVPNLILRHPFQPLGISTLNVPHTCFKLCRSSLPQRKSDSDLGPSTGVAPGIPHGFSHGNGHAKSSNIHLIVRIHTARSQRWPH